MNLFFRLLHILLFSRKRTACETFGPCVTPFRVWWTDLDILRHMNNGVYFSIGDLARTDYTIRAGLEAKIGKSGYYPVVVAETIRFHKSLKLLQKFHVTSRVIGWDEKAFLLGQEFKVKDVLMATSVVRARFLKKTGGSVSPAEILKLIGHTKGPPELEAWIRDWNLQQSR